MTKFAIPPVPADLVYNNEVTIVKDGAITLEGVPVQEGQRVKVLVYSLSSQDTVDPADLQGLPYQLIGPFEPAVPAER